MAGTCPEAITRAVVWAALWNALRDGLVDPRRFVQSALVAVESEAEPAVRDRLLALAHSAIRDYLPGGARQGLRELLSAATIRYARETGDADAEPVAGVEKAESASAGRSVGLDRP